MKLLIDNEIGYIKIIEIPILLTGMASMGGSLNLWRRNLAESAVTCVRDSEERGNVIS